MTTFRKERDRLAALPSSPEYVIAKEEYDAFEVRVIAARIKMIEISRSDAPNEFKIKCNTKLEELEEERRKLLRNLPNRV